MNHESILLGQILLKPDLLHRLTLTERNFTDPNLRRVFRAMHELASGGVEVDLLTLSDKGIHAGLLGSLNAPSWHNWEHYERQVIENSRRKCIEHLALEITDWSKSEMSSDEILSNIEGSIYDIIATRDRRSTRHISEIMSEISLRIEKAMTGPRELPGIPTGIQGLDQVILGFQQRLFYVFGARPSGGKTALLVNFMLTAAITCKRRVGFFSAESAGEELGMRGVSRQAKVKTQKIKTGSLQRNDFDRVFAACSEIGSSNIWIDDQPNISLADLAASARRMVTVNGVEIIFVDYILLIRAGNQYSPKNERVGLVTRGLKQLARDLAVPIVAVSQFNRTTANDKPTMESFKDSGDIEQDADVAGGLWHPIIDGQERSMLCIFKQRDGALADVPVKFHRDFVDFRDRETHEAF